LRVEDDGAGGAQLRRAGCSGLVGLSDRVATVDGTLEIVSPDGGPTTMSIEIPL
jgi:signal transduction histidine kinase